MLASSGYPVVRIEPLMSYPTLRLPSRTVPALVLRHAYASAWRNLSKFGETANGMTEKACNG
jgi:hypothetical protein